MQTLTLIEIIDKTVSLFARSVAENSANTAEEKHNDKSPHATSNASALSPYFGRTLISTFCTSVFKGFLMSAQLQCNLVDYRIVGQERIRFDFCLFDWWVLSVRYLQSFGFRNFILQVITTYRVLAWWLISILARERFGVFKFSKLLSDRLFILLYLRRPVKPYGLYVKRLRKGESI